jgi:hypothetical protein
MQCRDVYRDSQPIVFLNCFAFKTVDGNGDALLHWDELKMFMREVCATAVLYMSVRVRSGAEH